MFLFSKAPQEVVNKVYIYVYFFHYMIPSYIFIARHLCCFQRFTTKEEIPINGFAVRKHNLYFNRHCHIVSEMFLLIYSQQIV